MINDREIVYGGDNYANDPTNQITYNIKLYNHTSQTLSKSKFDGLLIYVQEILPGHLSVESKLSGWTNDIPSNGSESFEAIFWTHSSDEADYMNQLISKNYHYSYKWNDDNGDKLYKFYYDPDGVSLHNSDKVYMKYFNQRAISDTSELEIHIYSTNTEAGYTGSNGGGSDDTGGSDSGGNSSSTNGQDYDNYTNYPTAATTGWETYHKGKRAELMYASIIPSCTDACFFLTKYFVFAGVTSDEKELNYIYHEKVYTTKSRRYVFYEIDEATYNTHSNDNDYYRIDSVFGGLNVANCDFDKSTAAINGSVEGSNGNTFLGTTSPPKYIEDNIIKPSLHRLLTVTQEVGDQSGRQPTYNLNYGRVRPLGNPEDGKSNRKNDVVGSPFNGFSNNTLRARYASKTDPSDSDYQYGGVHYSFISNLGSDELHGDGPTSWPSGHSSQCWAMAMAVVQLYGLKYNNTSNGIQQGKIISTICKYVHKAYKFGVLRTVGRFHWNSDTMYGKIFGSLVMPILNASVDISNSGAQYYNELFDAAAAELFPNDTLTRIDSIPSIDTNDFYFSWFEDFKDLINQIGSDTNIGVPTLNDQNISESIFGYLWYMYKAGRVEVESNTTKVFDFFNNDNTQFYPDDDDNYYFDDNNDDIIENWENYRSWFPEVFPKNCSQSLKLLQEGNETSITYHGSNKSYYKNGDYRANISGLTRSKILCSWLMAFCLSELYISKAGLGSESLQTKIFNSAYNIGGGRELNFYDEYDTGYDPVYLRLAAGIIYCFNRGKFDSNVIHSLGNNIDLKLDTNSDNTITKTEADHIIVRREEDDVTDINKKLRLQSESGLWAQATVDYVVDNYFIFPNAPGPYTPGRQMSKPFEKGQYKVGDNSKIQGETQFIVPGVKIVNPNNNNNNNSSETGIVYKNYNLNQPLIEKDLVLLGNSLGNYKYSVGLLSDIHVNVDNNTSTDPNDYWYDEDDLKQALKVFTSEYNQKCGKVIQFICACGDVTESYCTDLDWPDVDTKEFNEVYTANAGALKFYSPLGNHDFMGMYNKREEDANTCDSSRSNTTNDEGYNSNVKARLDSLWYNYVQSPSIVGNNVHYFEYNAFIGIYKNKQITASTLQTLQCGDVPSQINDILQDSRVWPLTYKDNISGWNNKAYGENETKQLGMLNSYSKLNYWFEKDGDIYIIMSCDYGNDIWNATNEWQNRMICPRQIIDLDVSGDKINNPDTIYIRRMLDYVTDEDDPTGYNNDIDKYYNYQFYNPNVLIWLKEIIENNTDKKIFVFGHHFLPHKVGNSTRLPKETSGENHPWKYANIYPYDDTTDIDGIYSQAKITNNDSNKSEFKKGATTLCGIEFWFINKLNNKYKNVVFFSGHSHITWANMNDEDTEGVSDINSNKFKNSHIDNHDYNIVSPSNKGNAYVYTKDSSTPIGDSGYWVALPSLAKPTNPNYTGDWGKNTLRPNGDITIMDVYENGIKIKGWSMTRTEVESTTSGDTIVIELTDTTNYGIPASGNTSTIDINDQSLFRNYIKDGQRKAIVPRNLYYYKDYSSSGDPTWPGDNDEEYAKKIMKKAYEKTYNNSNWQGYSDSNKVTLRIKNNTGTHVLFNGKLVFNFNINGETKSLYCHHRVETPSSLCGSTGHWYYGHSESQPTNFIIQNSGYIDILIPKTVDNIDITQQTFADNNRPVVLYASGLTGYDNGNFNLHNIEMHLCGSAYNGKTVKSCMTSSSGSTTEPKKDVYFNFKLVNVCDYEIKIIGKIKFFVEKVENGKTYWVQLYFDQYPTHVYAADIVIPAHQSITLDHTTFTYKGTVNDVSGTEWVKMDVPLSFMNGGTIFPNNTDEDNRCQLYVYTYITEYGPTGTGLDNNNVIKTELVSSGIFNWDENNIQTHTINIRINEQTTFWSKN